MASLMYLWALLPLLTTADTPKPIKESSPCFFPFIYNGKKYSSCTEDGRTDEKLWCATTSSYDADRKWNFCTVTAPKPIKESSPCFFPFVYNGKNYSSCTADGRTDGKLWCATTSSYDADRKWNFCTVTGPKPFKESSPCVFPFVYDGKNYSSCTADGRTDGKLWCATTSSYDADRKWNFCTVTDYEGNSGGQPCVFPFIYRKRTFYTCTDEYSDGRFWCATSGNYDQDKKWSYCTDTRLPANSQGPCVFPFTYRGKSYSSCTTDGASKGQLWCSLTSNYDESPKWTYCKPSEPLPCHFPFIYNGKSYSSCTKAGSPDNQLWCSTTANYDSDKKWRACALQDYEGNSGGQACVFPFIYKKRTFYNCTNENSDGRFWCATSGNYDQDKKWSYCSDTRLSLNTEGPCVFPFIYHGKSYSSCTTDGASKGQLWCSLTNNYDKSPRWTYCKTSEYEGSSWGQPCVFPFIYRKRTFYTCTDEYSYGRFWCATSGNYDKDKKWSYCADTRLSANSQGPCIFPFTYRGKSYSSCTTDGASKGQLWCSLTSNYDESPKWTYCKPSKPLPCHFPFIYNGKSYSTCTKDGSPGNQLWCATTANYDTDKKWRACALQDYEGNSGGKPCVFPFIYDERTFYSCTNEYSDGRFWCATSGNYDEDKTWSYCADTRLSLNTEGSCIFPFFYHGKSYSSCTTDGASKGQLWCSLTSNYDESSKWTYCKTSEYEGNSGGQPCVFPFIYRKRTFYTCTDAYSHGRFWCATSGNYDKDKKWSYCADTRLSANSQGPCVFPFIYHGKSYSSCTTDGASKGQLWCSLTSNYDVSPKWTYCKPSEPLPCHFPFIYNGKSYSACTKDGSPDKQLWCATTANYDSDKKWRACALQDYEGNSGGQPCVFPFIYKKQTFYTCTNEYSDGRFWCATSGNYDKDKKWSYCADTRLNANPIGPCVFPFIYKGKSYSSCTTDGTSGQYAWCSLTSNYDKEPKWTPCHAPGN